MALVRSLGTLQRGGFPVPPPTLLRTGATTALGSMSYADIYRLQPEVRVVIEFLGRNVADLGLNLYELVDENDRRRDRDHPSIKLLQRPNWYTTRYRLIEGTVQDLAIFGHAFWIKVRSAGATVTALVPVPPDRMAVAGDIYPVGYQYSYQDGRTRDLAPSDVVHFRWYDPIDSLRGVSPLETLKGIIAESRAAATTRIAFWKNGARVSGFIQRPLEARPWSVEARDRFKRQFEDRFTGAQNAGKFPVLEEGMSFHPITSTMVDAESVATQKLTRAEAARAYHIPLPMVGILDHATFSNIKEQHRHLYQDCLGPVLTMLQEELELQLLPEFPGASTRYLEFNIAQKLAGSFEEQAAALQTLVGRPVMSVNEGRARLNLSSKPNEDAIAAPLNMTTGEVEVA
jgi:HK97 family phage portal protein